MPTTPAANVLRHETLSKCVLYRCMPTESTRNWKVFVAPSWSGEMWNHRAFALFCAAFVTSESAVQTVSAVTFRHTGACSRSLPNWTRRSRSESRSL